MNTPRVSSLRHVCVLALAIVGACTDDAVTDTEASTGGASSSSDTGVGSESASSGGGSTSGADSSGGPASTTGDGSSGSAGSSGGATDTGSVCPVDCAMEPAGPCEISVCNEGRYPGPIGECVLLDAGDGTECDDGLFCTVGETCMGGACGGGAANLCGLVPEACHEITCDEAMMACAQQPRDEGMSCTPIDLCEDNGICMSGVCVGTPVDCTMAPTGPCQMATCNPATGACEAVPDPALDGSPCDDGDPCSPEDACNAGICEPVTFTDCSGLDAGCSIGVCDPMTGGCVTAPAPVGLPCTDGIGECEAGTCDALQTCVAGPAMEGAPCSDASICTGGDTCMAGVCLGAPVVGCDSYFAEPFEACPLPGWTLAGEWECGAPTLVGPPTAFAGNNVVGTDLDDLYDPNQTYTGSYAETPPIDLTGATSPALHLYQWVDTEGAVYDGYNVKISTDGGATFSVLTTVTPAYPLVVASEPAYGGHVMAWQEVIGDLAAYAGQTVLLRFSFRSDSSIVFPGVYIDELEVVEADAIPLAITTAGLPDAVVGIPYAATIARSGGTANAAWSIVAGGTNTAWLSIDPTGQLTGTPGPGESGPVSVTIRVEEPSNPGNFDEVTYGLSVLDAVYVDDLEAPCPGGWTLSSAWACGTPSVVGPGTAYSGTQLLATNLVGNYADGLAWATSTATSAAYDLSATVAPQLRFRVWYLTEGGAFDGFNVKASTDGIVYSILPMVTPAYPLLIDGEAAWGGDGGGTWYEFTADLGAYAGAGTVYLQFAMRSDASVNHPGVYIDDVVILG